MLFSNFYLFSPLFLFSLFIFFFSVADFSLRSSFSYSFTVSDEVSLFIVFITLFVIFVSYFFSFSSDSVLSKVILLLITFFSLIVFIVNNVFLLYFFYEASLIPILYIIIKWGSYPERSVSSLILLVYTAVCSFPFIFFMFYMFSNEQSFNLAVSSYSLVSLPNLISILILVSFSVKLPVYGLHFWLPIAHVEAPTFGSMILAGVLLKLGGVGLLRLSNFVNFSFLSNYFLGYLLLFLSLVTLICCFQTDFKRIVAYSSVSHMIAVPILFLSNNLLSVKSLVIIMFFHGLSSPVLFMLVGILYSLFSSRQLVVIRGLLLISPLLSFTLILAFFFTISAPPFPSFVAEVMFFVSSLMLSNIFVYSVLLFTFLSLVYNLLWFRMINFSSVSLTFNTSINLNFSSFYSLFSSFMLCFLFLVLVSFI